MIPILYEANATDFTKAGLGQLSRVVDCKVRENLNGTFELYMDILRDDPLFSAIDVGAIIVAKPNQTQGNQPFVIEQINKSIDGLINIYATHIGQYRAKLIPIKPFNATSLADTLNKISTYSAETNMFTFYTDKTVSSAFSIKSPRSLRELLGGKEGSILDVYGGELFFDNYNVYLFTRRGRKSENINIMYGDNMTDYTQTDVFSWSKSITGVLPYYYKKDNTSETYVEGDIQYSDYVDYFTYHKTIPVDFTDKFANETPTKAKLNLFGSDYVKKSGMPQVSIEASFEDITTLPLYNPIKREIDVLQLGDYVNVINNEYNVNITTRIRELEYDVLLERYTTINIGDETETINDVISDTASDVTNYYDQTAFKLRAFVIDLGDQPIAANSTRDYNQIDLTDTGYTPIAIAGFWGVGSYGNHLILQPHFYAANSGQGDINQNRLDVRIKNTGTGATTTSTRMVIQILYRKD